MAEPPHSKCSAGINSFIVLSLKLRSSPRWLAYYANNFMVKAIPLYNLNHISLVFVLLVLFVFKGLIASQVRMKKAKYLLVLFLSFLYRKISAKQGRKT